MNNKLFNACKLQLFYQNKMQKNNNKETTAVIINGFRNYDCVETNWFSHWQCNLLTQYPQDVIFDMYSCLSNKSNH